MTTETTNSGAAATCFVCNGAGYRERHAGAGNYLCSQCEGKGTINLPSAATQATSGEARPLAAAVRAAERIDAMHKGVVDVFAAIRAEHVATTTPTPAAPTATSVAGAGLIADIDAEMSSNTLNIGNLQRLLQQARAALAAAQTDLGLARLAVEQKAATLAQADARIAELEAQLAAAAQAPAAKAEPVGEVKLGAHGKLIDWFSSEHDLYALPVGTKLYTHPVAQADDVRDAALEEAALKLAQQYTWISNVAAANIVRALKRTTSAAPADKEGE